MGIQLLCKILQLSVDLYNLFNCRDKPDKGELKPQMHVDENKKNSCSFVTGKKIASA
jgi:hypothetical protein